MRPRHIHRPARLGLAWLTGLMGFALLAGCDRPAPIQAGPRLERPAPENIPKTEIAPPDIGQPATVGGPAWMMGRPPPPAASRDERIAVRQLKRHWHQSAAQFAEDPIWHLLLGRHDIPDPEGARRFLLVYASRHASEECSACVPYLSFFEFRSATPTDQPELVMASIQVMRAGYAGEPPPYSVHGLGENRYGVSFVTETAAQGVYRDLTILTPLEGRMRVIFDRPISESHEQLIGDGDDRTSIYIDWETRYRFEPGPEAFPDLYLERHLLSGRDFLLDPRHSPFARDRTPGGRVATHLIYRFDGRRYRLVRASQPPQQRRFSHSS